MPATLSQLEARVVSLERQAPRPGGLLWAANGSVEVPPGNADTVMNVDVEFHPPFPSVPVVVANAGVDALHSGQWWGGNKDSFAVTIYGLTHERFRAVVRRVDGNNIPIVQGVVLNWIAVLQRPQE